MVSPWQPLKVLRRIPTVIPSSTSPYHIVTDAGNAFLKMPNNPQGPAAIVSEFIGTQLAAWFGLSTFEYCMMQVCEADLNVDRQDQTDLVMAFVTHEDDGDTRKGSAKELQLVENVADFSRLVVFDTWVGNWDRHSIRIRAGEVREHRNDGNVFLSNDAAPGKLKLKGYDHTHCHFAVIASNPDVNLEGKITDDAIYGRFPEFLPFLKRSDIQASLVRLAQMDTSTAQQIVQTVPSEWMDNAGIQGKLVEFIKSRSEFLCNQIEGKLCD